MKADHLIFLSVPGLRPCDVDRVKTPTLFSWANAGVLAELAPTFPCVTSCVQASMWTGRPPGEHGIIANGFFFCDRREVEFWVGRNGVIEQEQVWDLLRGRRPGMTSAVWHAQNIRDAAADFIVTPEPIHEPDGSTKLWCYSKPEGLYLELLDALGHFPLMNYWGPMANVKSTQWILDAAAWLNERRRPNLHWIYVPHLDYAAQKFGPNSAQAATAVGELDQALAAFAGKIASSPISKQVVFLIVGEYALTDVSTVSFPNRLLRQAGFLKVKELDDREHLDLDAGAAFAMVDHQFAHVFVNSSDPAARGIEAVCAVFRGQPGIAAVLAGDERGRLGLIHPRCGDVILVAEEDAWFAYYWWLDDAKAPAFARTVDIHNKPGYDPVELFFDPSTKGIPLDASLVRGSHGAPARAPNQRTALICSSPSGAVEAGKLYRDVDMKPITLSLLGLD